MSNTNFNLNEWVGKGEKNLLNEARDDDDFMTTISPEEQGVDPADATLEEDELEEEQLEENVALKAFFAALGALLGSQKIKNHIFAAKLGTYGEKGQRVAELADKILQIITGEKPKY